MIRSEHIDRRAVLCGLGAALAAGPAAGQAARTPARVRLIGGALEADGTTLLSGIVIALDPGWKTYWRVPGESGLAPSFDWSRSRNLGSAEVLFPAPERLSDGFGEILGYRGTVVFPVHVRPADQSRPVDLNLTLGFGVCERVCIPAQAVVTHAVGRMSPPAADTALLHAHLARVPRAVDAGTAVRAWTVDRAAGELRFQTALPGGVAHAVVEAQGGPALALPRIERNGDGTASLRVAIGPDHRGGARVTVVGPGSAVEERHALD